MTLQLWMVFRFHLPPPVPHCSWLHKKPISLQATGREAWVNSTQNCWALEMLGHSPPKQPLHRSQVSQGCVELVFTSHGEFTQHLFCPHRKKSKKWQCRRLPLWSAKGTRCLREAPEVRAGRISCLCALKKAKPEKFCCWWCGSVCLIAHLQAQRRGVVLQVLSAQNSHYLMK